MREARAVRPPDAAVQRALAALGVSGAAGTIGSSAAASAAVAQSSTGALATLLAKWLVIGVAGGLVTMGAANRVSNLFAPTQSPAPRAQLQPTSDPTDPTGRVVDSRHLAKAALQPAPETQNGSMPPAVSVRRSTEPSYAARAVTEREAPPVSPSPPQTTSSLAREIALIDQARSALEAEDPARALAVLDGYRREAPRGRLAPEAAYLRVQALLKQHDRRAAEDEARNFLESDPTSPHAKRVRTLLYKARSEDP